MSKERDLRDCYEEAKDLIANPDTFDVVREVDKYREFWKPDEIAVILLAESHVHTSQDDFAHHWHYGDYQGNYVRFVYCLANGERDLVDMPSNRGTWQFWKLLFSCVNRVSRNEDFGLILRNATPDFDRRLGNKIQLLQRLKKEGIWLVDASIIGVNGLSEKLKTSVIQHCWQGYIGPMLGDLIPKPRHVIIIGSGVEKTLGNELRELELDYTPVKQPQARLRGGYGEYYRKCFDICSEFRVVQ